MAEITIQLDDGLMSELERQAAGKHLPVPMWIKKLILRGLKQEWPEDYFSLFGSLADTDFSEPAELSFQKDCKRIDL